METVTLKLPPDKIFEINYPLREWEVSNEVFDFIKGNKLEPKISYLLKQFLETYNFTTDYCCVKMHKNYSWASGSDRRKLMVMRDIIEGMFRISPVEVETSKDKATWNPVYDQWIFSEDLEKISYQVNGKKYKTPLFWVYTPNFRQAFFGKTKDNVGFDLQPWQEDFRLQRWRITLVIGARDSWKSLVSTDLVAEYLFRELISYKEQSKRFEIHYYGLTKDNNTTVAQYIKAMAMSLIDYKGVVTWSKSRQELVMKDWKQERVVRFMSWVAEEAGRWQKPVKVVIDEWGFYKNDRIWRIALGHTNIPVTVISTVDSETPRQWFIENWLEYSKLMRDYKPVEELIHETWVKFWFNKIGSRDDVLRMIDDGVFDAARSYFYKHRPFVALKYTIEDIDNAVMSEDVKEWRIVAASMISEEYMLAEYFGELYDWGWVLSYDWLVDSEHPEQYERVVFAYDEAEDYDNPAISLVWLLDNKAYVIYSEYLEFSDIFERYAYMKGKLRDAANYVWWAFGNVHFVADVTRANSIYREVREHVWDIDCPVKYTGGTDVNKSRPFHKVGKKYLVDVTKNYFLDVGAISFHTSLDWEKGLLSEMDTFVKFKNGSFWASSKKYKDDKVNSLLIALYYIYVTWTKETMNKHHGYRTGSMTYDPMAVYNNSQIKTAEQRNNEAFVRYKRLNGW